MYCNYQQMDWVHLLSLAEFAYNNAPSATTRVSLFYTNKGYHPRLQTHLLQNPLSESARLFTEKLESVHSQLKEAILAAQRCYQAPTNAQRLPPPNFQVGDQVFVLAKYLRTTQPSRKLAECFLGPFTVTRKPSAQSYQVKLPDYLHSVHPVFHVSHLEPAIPSTIPNQTNPPPPPIKVNGDLEYKISRILDSKWDRCRKPPLLYYIQWAGYEGTDEEFSWISASELPHTGELVQDFHLHHPG